MNHLNTCLIEGNITRDPEIKTIGDGEKSVTVFTVAQHKSYVNSRKEVIEEVNFITCEAWGNGFAEKIAKYLRKGTLTRVQGRLKQDAWTDEEGKKHERIIIVADNVDFRPSAPKDDGKSISTGEAMPGTCDVEIIEDGADEIENAPTSGKKRKK